MATSWQVAGDYLETCSCDFLCPCLPSNLADPPTKGWCTFAMVFRVGSGRYGAVSLDGLAFAVVGHTPGRMADGNWSVGVITDERGSAEQREALAAIASGQAGGPMAALGPLVGRVLGVEPPAPLTMVIAPGGEVLYRKEGTFDILEVRRIILAAMPDTSGYIGSKAYWMRAVDEMKKKRGTRTEPATAGSKK